MSERGKRWGRREEGWGTDGVGEGGGSEREGVGGRDGSEGVRRGLREGGGGGEG